MKRAYRLLLPGLVIVTYGARAEDKKGTVVTIDGLKSTTPAVWKVEKPPKESKKFRLHQFRVPKAGDDKEDALMLVIYLGEGSGGTAKDNVERWKGLFTPPKGKDIDDVTKVEKMKVSSVEVTYVDVRGTYNGAPFEKAKPKPNYRMLAVYFDSKTGPYFFRMVGPAKTVAEHKKGFDEWLKAFK
jgi:hypothetical protein